MRFKTISATTALVLTATSAFSSGINQGIEKILTQMQQPAHVGIVIRQAKNGKVIYNSKGKYLFAPASVQKLLTATAALDYLGPNFTFKTTLFVDGVKRDHTLKGNVLIKFSGDPELGSDDIEQLVEGLKDKGITKIQGHIYIDSSSYDHISYPPGWLWDDLSYSYAAPLSAVVLNKNSFILRLTPSKKLGLPPALSVNIPNNVIHFTNDTKTTAHYNKECPLTIYSHADNHYTLAGCLNKDWGRQRRNLAIRNPISYAKVVIREALADNQIKFSGKITEHTVTKGYKKIAQHSSDPLRKILKDMLKKSDNLISDSLLKQIGHRYYKQPGSWHNGVLALTKILKGTHINFKKNLIDDGAGLSRYNLLTPYQLTQLLQYIYKKPTLRPTMIQALPVGGVDGTLVERMISEANEKRIHAKTGSMAGITSLAGFVYTKHLGTLTFAIMINGFVGKHVSFNRLEDKICKYLVHYSTGKKHG